MGTKVEACVECTHKCLLVHGKKKKASPVFDTFFKVLIGNQFSKVMFLPPRFAPTVSTLVDQKVVLEDSRGLHWKVTVSRTGGSLAFLQGWNIFSVDHDLQDGEFLVFNYIMPSHFIVKIYDKSGCEKLKFPETRNQTKRTRDNGISTVKDGPCHTIDKSLLNKRGSSAFVAPGSDADIGQHVYELNVRGKAPIVTKNASNCEMNDMGKSPVVMENASNHDISNEKSNFMPQKYNIEEMICMVDRDLVDFQEEDRTCLFDLFNFEMFDKYSGAGGSNEVAPIEAFSHRGDSSLRLRNEAGSVDQNPVAKEAMTTDIPMDETCSHHDDSSLRLSSEAGSNDKTPVPKEAVATAIPLDASEFDKTEKNNSSEANARKASPVDEDTCINKTYGHLFPKAAVNPQEDEKNISSFSNRAIQKCPTADGSESLSGNDQVALSGKEHDGIGDSFQGANKEFTEITVSFDKMMKTIKKESVEWAPDLCGLNIRPQTIGESSKVFEVVCDASGVGTIQDNDRVVPEPLDPVKTLPRSFTATCLVEPGDRSFLKWPVSLPIPVNYKGRAKMDRRVLYLRDPLMRLWPVLYIDKVFSRMLTAGWEAFSQANNIQPGEECAIGIVNGFEGICSVDIIRKDWIHRSIRAIVHKTVVEMVEQVLLAKPSIRL